MEVLALIRVRHRPRIPLRSIQATCFISPLYDYNAHTTQYRELSLQIKNHKDFYAGLLFSAFGAFFTYFSMQYPMRTAANAGPGYFPFYLGLVLMILGAIISLTAFSKKADDEQVGHFDFKVLILVLGAVVAFGLLLQPLGLVPGKMMEENFRRALKIGRGDFTTFFTRPLSLALLLLALVLLVLLPAIKKTREVAFVEET